MFEENTYKFLNYGAIALKSVRLNSQIKPEVCLEESLIKIVSNKNINDD